MEYEVELVRTIRLRTKIRVTAPSAAAGIRRKVADDYSNYTTDTFQDGANDCEPYCQTGWGFEESDY